MRTLIILCTLLIAVFAHQASYFGYKVYRVHPASEDEVKLLVKFEDNQDVDFWSNLRYDGKHIDVMVAPRSQFLFTMFLRAHRIHFTIHIENVEAVFEEERRMQSLAPQPRQGRISFAKYNRFDEIIVYLGQLEADHPDLVSLQSIGKSYEGRDMLVIKISSDPTANKPIIFIDAGIHAREWIAPAMAQYIIQELVEDLQNRDLLDKVDWHILPLANPDGYEFSHTNRRMWRKTTSPQERCNGTDGNRNFEFHWGEIGASSNSCDETFMGPQPFSEVETRNARDYMLSLQDRAKLYLNFHSFGNYFLYPWGFTTELPENDAELRTLAEDANKAIVNAGGDEYTIGSTRNVLYPASGLSIDWAAGVAGIELSYTVELPGGDSGFDPPPSQILPFVMQTFQGVKVFGKYITNKFG